MTFVKCHTKERMNEKKKKGDIPPERTNEMALFKRLISLIPRL